MKIWNLIRKILIILLLSIAIIKVFTRKLDHIALPNIDAVALICISSSLILFIYPLLGSKVKGMRESIENEIFLQTVAIFLCVFLIFIRILYPTAKIDIISLYLLLIALGFYLLPKFKGFRPKNIEIGNFFKLELDNLERMTEEAEKKSGLGYTDSEKLKKEEKSEEQNKYVKEEKENQEKDKSKKVYYTNDDDNSINTIITVNNPNLSKEKILLISDEIEKKLRKLLLDAGLLPIEKYTSMKSMLTILIQNNLIDIEILTITNEFMKIRQFVVHGLGDHLSDELVLRTVDLGIKILKLIPDGVKNN